jgi:hypothetical protein
MSDESSPFHPKNIGLNPEQWAIVPTKIKKRQKHFMPFPVTWYERMNGADGQTYRVALYLCYLGWKNKGESIKLANGMLKIDGVPPTTKRRALRDLERRGMITVERWPKKSPVVRLMK